MDRKPVPWILLNNPVLKSWTWDTEHFDAVILAMGNVNSYSWKVVDKSGSEPVQLEFGETRTFTEAEEEVLEIISKSYPIRCGYHAYAGDLATSFIVKNGKKVDFAPYVGSNVILEIFNKKNPEQTSILVGTLTISHFNLELKTERDSTLVIPPSFIIDVKKEFDPTAMQERKPKVGSRRVFQEEWRKGCTGAPGYVAGTVVHNPNDAFCPIHDG